MNQRHVTRRLRRGLAAASPQAFDGHTAFAQMTPEQRLHWPDAACEFITACRGAASQHPAPYHATPSKNKSTG